MLLTYQLTTYFNHRLKKIFESLSHFEAPVLFNLTGEYIGFALPTSDRDFWALGFKMRYHLHYVKLYVNAAFIRAVHNLLAVRKMGQNFGVSYRQL